MASTLQEQVLTAQSALDTASAAVPTQGFNNFQLMVKFGAGTSAGAVVLEAADTAGYTGTWMAVGAAVPWSAVNKIESIAVVNRVLPFVRARISTAIVGGTVDVVLVAN